MRPLVIALLLVGLFMAGGLYFQLWSPSAVKKHATEAALQQLSDAAETQDKARVAQTLRALLTDDAKIHLEVHIYSIADLTGKKPMVEDFDKESFLGFVDNILYTVTDFHYRPKLTAFAMNEDGQSAAVTFTSSEFADGPSYYGAVPVIARFSTSTGCNGTVVFTGAQPQLKEATCSMQLRAVPKSTEGLSAPGSLQEMLKHH